MDDCEEKLTDLAERFRLLRAQLSGTDRRCQQLQWRNAKLEAVSAAAREYLLSIEDQDLERSKSTILHLADALHALEQSHG